MIRNLKNFYVSAVLTRNYPEVNLYLTHKVMEDMLLNFYDITESLKAGTASVYDPEKNPDGDCNYVNPKYRRGKYFIYLNPNKVGLDYDQNLRVCELLIEEGYLKRDYEYKDKYCLTDKYYELKV